MAPTLPSVLRAVRWPHARGQLAPEMHGGGNASMLNHGMQHAAFCAGAGARARVSWAAPVSAAEGEVDDEFIGRE